MGYLICNKCKSYYELGSGENGRDYVEHCVCGAKLRYIENMDIVDPRWKPVLLSKKPPKIDIFKNRFKKIFTLPDLNLKVRLNNFWNKLLYRIHISQGNNSYQGTGINSIYDLQNEFNLKNIQWPLVLPVIVILTILLTLSNGIFSLLTLLLLVAVGYFFNNQIIGIKNALITGAISYFMGSLLSGSFLIIIPYTILGAINGAVCGWIGGYLNRRLKSR